MNPLVSVVMPVFNGENYLREAIESILAQTMPDFELIIVNDGSTDKTGEILEEFQHKSERIIVLRQDNIGVIHARNAACRQAKGKYIAFLDADDIALPNRLAKQTEFLEKHRTVALLGGGIEQFFHHGKSCGNVVYPTNDAEIRAVFSRFNPFATSAVMVRTAVISHVGGFRSMLKFAEDYDLWLRISEVGEVANLPEILTRYRVHTDNTSWKNCPNVVIACLYARYSATLRASNREDIYNEEREFSTNLLGEIGCSPSEIGNSIAEDYATWIRFMTNAGEFSLAEEVLRQALRDAPAFHAEARYIAKLFRVIAQNRRAAGKKFATVSAVLKSWKIRIFGV